MEGDPRVSERVVGSSYLSVLGGQKVYGSSLKEDQNICLELLPTEETLQELEGCFVGTLNQHCSFSLIKHNLVMEGLSEIKMVDMGDKLVLIQS